MKPELILIICIFIGFSIIEFFKTGFFTKQNEVNGDATVEFFSALLLLLFTQPLVLFLGGYLAHIVVPDAQNSLKFISPIYAILLFLIFDDMLQYWWHRITHNTPWLYKLHRPHHNAEYLSVRVVYRNNVFYYWLLPGLWCSGVLIYLGLGWVYAGYIVVKMLVITGAHSDVRWDQKLYAIKWLSPLMWVLERTISTPATHSAHHGKHLADGITHYKGNYGNLLFFWDILFGTAKITRQYPAEMGVENLPETSVAEQLFWPLVKH